MESALAVRPLQEALAALTASYLTDEDLRELLIRLSDKSAAAAVQTIEWGEEAYVYTQVRRLNEWSTKWQNCKRQDQGIAKK